MSGEGLEHTTKGARGHGRCFSAHCWCQADRRHQDQRLVEERDPPESVACAEAEALSVSWVCMGEREMMRTQKRTQRHERELRDRCRLQRDYLMRSRDAEW